MSEHHHEATLPLLATYAPPTADIDRIGRTSLIIGVVGLLASAGLGFTNPDRFFQSYLTSYVWVLAIPLGSFGLMCIHHLSRGGWGLMIRRTLEAATRTIPMLALAFAPIPFALKKLYPWAAGHDHGSHFRAHYLTPGGFIGRAIGFFVIWTLFATIFSRLSLKQDKTGDGRLEKKMQRIAAAAVILHVIGVSSAAIDWLMSLTPHWMSTIFGFYMVIGQGVAALAFIILVSLFLANRAPLEGRFRADHFHDYGKLLLAFIMIWAYFSVSQFLIIWSGNLPEETGWYMNRVNGGWKFFSLVLVLFHFVLPFVLLLSRNLKRAAPRLAKVAAMMLLVRWLDLHWLVAPAFSNHMNFNPLDFTTAFGLGGIWFFLFTRELRTRSLLPDRERGLKEALGHG